MVAYSYHNQDDLVFFDAKGRITKRISKFVSSQIGSSVMSNGTLAVDGLGNIYFLDEMSGYVLLFGPDGKYLNRFGGVGNKPGMFNAAAEGLTVDGKSNIYVADFSGIEILDSQGHYQSTLKLPGGAARSLAVSDQNELYALANMTVYRLNIPAGS
jgi:sugar lactone lactonase YvrE